MSGWIKLHRGWRDCEVFGGAEPMSEREAWVWLIEHAAWKDTRRRTAKGERIEVKRGQYHTSLRTLGDTFGWGKNKVARFLDRLVEHEMIGTVAGQSGILVTICNYSKYQDEEVAEEPSCGTVAGQSRDTQEERKELKEEKLAARGPEILGFVGEVARAAGVASADHGRIAEQNLLVRAWVDAGANRGLILKTIERCAATAKAQPRSLRYFDGAVRDAIAKQATTQTESDRMIAEIQARKAA